MTKKKKTVYYDFLVSTWEHEIERMKHHLFDIELNRGMDSVKKEALIKAYKNRIKRCKYNITRAKNLKKV